MKTAIVTDVTFHASRMDGTTYPVKVRVEGEIADSSVVCDFGDGPRTINDHFVTVLRAVNTNTGEDFYMTRNQIELAEIRLMRVADVAGLTGKNAA